MTEYVKAPKPSVVAYTAFKASSTVRIFAELSHLLMKKNHYIIKTQA